MASRIPRRLFFPDVTLTLLRKGIQPEKELSKLQFKVDAKWTKPEIKNVLEAVYGLDVEKVNTMVYEGRLRRPGSAPGRRFRKDSDFKKAVVTLKEPVVFNEKS